AMEPETIRPTSFTWNVSGSRIRDWTANLEAASWEDLDSYLNNNSGGLTFYWWNADEAGSDLTVSCAVGSTDGPFFKTVHFSVKKPHCDFDASFVPGALGEIRIKNSYCALGDRNVYESGIKFSASFSNANGFDQFEFVQTLDDWQLADADL